MDLDKIVKFVLSVWCHQVEDSGRFWGCHGLPVNARSAANHTQIQVLESGQFPKSGATFLVYTGSLENDCLYLPMSSSHIWLCLAFVWSQIRHVSRQLPPPQMLLKPLLITTERPEFSSSKCGCRCVVPLGFLDLATYRYREGCSCLRAEGTDLG